VLRGKDVQEIEELKRQGLSIRAISRLPWGSRGRAKSRNTGFHASGEWPTSECMGAVCLTGGAVLRYVSAADAEGPHAPRGIR